MDGRIRTSRIAIALIMVGAVGALITFGALEFVDASGWRARLREMRSALVTNPAVAEGAKAVGIDLPLRLNPPSCDSQRPIFLYGFAILRAQVGPKMGEPSECEHAIHANGDTRQQTTTGYAYYRKASNVPAFTNEWDHWALTESGLVYWAGDVVDPPSLTREGQEVDR